MIPLPDVSFYHNSSVLYYLIKPLLPRHSPAASSIIIRRDETNPLLPFLLQKEYILLLTNIL